MLILHIPIHESECVCVLSVEEVSLDVGGNLLLPLVSVAEQLLLIVEQLLVCLCRELKVRTLDKNTTE